MTTHATTLLCPICTENQLKHVHCSHPSCSFFVTTCPNCDKAQVVAAFMSDHEEDCDCRQTVPFERASQPTLQFKRVA